MIMTYFWCLCAGISGLWALFHGQSGQFGTAMLEGAAAAITVSVSIAGPLSLWNGLGNLMSGLGITGFLAKLFSPVMCRIFPSARKDPELSESLCANVCANLLGLGNAATPMGIRAVRRMQANIQGETASDEMCRLVVMNTASIQLIPSTVAALRAGAGAAAPFDILPCVWISSVLSVSAGLAAAYCFRRVWSHV